ncbi:hypothetical protein EWW49_24815 [Pseudomonas syringae]|nr:hypothetical protein EWW49_24815 [Pseudomonas syringae]
MKGATGANEFEGTDYELAPAIMEVSYITFQSANGLKVKLPTGSCIVSEEVLVHFNSVHRGRFRETIWVLKIVS